MTSGDDDWLGALPFGLLALGTAVAALSNDAFGEAAADLELMVGVAVAAAFWMAAGRLPTFGSAPAQQVVFVGRTLLAFWLTWLNPFFAIFALVGFIDVEEHFEGWRAYPGVAVSALIMAGSQSGGLPPRDLVHGLVIAVLMVLNGGLWLAFTRMHRRVEVTSQARADTISDLERLNAELEQALAENADLHATVTTQAREAGVRDERQRLAREIHDTLAQGLAGIVAQLQASQDEPDPERRRSMIERATAVSRELMIDARRSVLDLSPVSLDDSTLHEAVGALVTAWDDEHDPEAHLVVTGEARRLHPEVESTVIRVVQEALANVAKHARARRVGVTLSYGEDELMVDVRDDGVGFGPEVPSGPGFGLRGMRQRAERLAGALTVESEPDRGVAISLQVPAIECGAA